MEIEGAVMLAVLPFYHIFALFANILTGLAWGRTSVVLPGFEPISFLESIHKHKVCHTARSLLSLTECIHLICLFDDRLNDISILTSCRLAYYSQYLQSYFSWPNIRSWRNMMCQASTESFRQQLHSVKTSKRASLRNFQIAP